MNVTLYTDAETRLRDAAADMKEALQTLVYVFESEYGNDASSPAIKAARAALTKAGR